MRLSLGRHSKNPRSLGDASFARPALLREILDEVRRCPHPGQAGKVGRLRRLIEAQAWAEAALALIDLKLPQWRLRRITYDGGQWHCALSRQRELPDWLDQSAEASHSELSLAILDAVLEAQRLALRCGMPSVPPTPREVMTGDAWLCCDNFS
jgi:hypothetical protein